MPHLVQTAPKSPVRFYSRLRTCHRFLPASARLTVAYRRYHSTGPSVGNIRRGGDLCGGNDASRGAFYLCSPKQVAMEECYEDTHVCSGGSCDACHRHPGCCWWG